MGFEGNDAVPLVSVGGGANDDFVGPMAATEHLRRMPYVAALMAELGGVWGRSRLMGLGAGATVPQHVDIHYYWRTHIRIHIPVVTNPGVRFRCGQDEVHMRPGEAWVFDSFRIHEVRNEGSEKRIHLVLDTVGSQPIWDLIEAANQNAPVPAEPWQPTATQSERALHFEHLNQPVVMNSWEMRCHLDYLLKNVAERPAEALLRSIERFIFAWHAVWTEHGESEAAWPLYRTLIGAVRQELLQLGAAEVPLTNQAPLYRALDALIFSRALTPANAKVTAAVSPTPEAA